jgi:hypothetical protein
VDLEDAQDEVRRDADLRKKFSKLADRILSIVQGDPVLPVLLDGEEPTSIN